MAYIYPSKNRDWQSGLKNKIQIYVAYKKHTSNITILVVWI